MNNNRYNRIQELYKECRFMAEDYAYLDETLKDVLMMLEKGKPVDSVIAYIKDAFEEIGDE